ncbi:DUF1422 family protein [Gallaecimonas sp. GXIMD4217]|uniref:DUF1422 family protein n=1 Tax=Gallaecimonas sp. GXIMD4217 TaxID=3131927 RepID=UPI00311AD6DF
MLKKNDKWTLALTALIGLSANASLATLTNALVPFSIFPLLVLVLAIRELRRHLDSAPLTDESRLASLASFLLGALSYSVMLRVQYPELGDVFLPLMCILPLVLWLMYKLGFFSSSAEDGQ